MCGSDYESGKGGGAGEGSKPTPPSLKTLWNIVTKNMSTLNIKKKYIPLPPRTHPLLPLTQTNHDPPPYVFIHWTIEEKKNQKSAVSQNNINKSQRQKQPSRFLMRAYGGKSMQFLVHAYLLIRIYIWYALRFLKTPILCYFWLVSDTVQFTCSLYILLYA